MARAAQPLQKWNFAGVRRMIPGFDGRLHCQDGDDLLGKLVPIIVEGSKILGRIGLPGNDNQICVQRGVPCEKGASPHPAAKLRASRVSTQYSASDKPEVVPRARRVVLLIQNFLNFEDYVEDPRNRIRKELLLHRLRSGQALLFQELDYFLQTSLPVTRCWFCPRTTRLGPQGHCKSRLVARRAPLDKSEGGVKNKLVLSVF